MAKRIPLRAEDAFEFIHSLPPPEFGRFIGLYIEPMLTEFAARLMDQFQAIRQDSAAEQWALIRECLEEYRQLAGGLFEQWQAVIPKPRNTERDAEIVRLRDRKGLTFGKIALKLRQINPRWARPDGKPLARDSVERAYYRQKNKPPSP